MGAWRGGARGGRGSPRAAAEARRRVHGLVASSRGEGLGHCCSSLAPRPRRKMRFHRAPVTPRASIPGARSPPSPAPPAPHDASVAGSERGQVEVLRFHSKGARVGEGPAKGPRASSGARGASGRGIAGSLPREVSGARRGRGRRVRAGCPSPTLRGARCGVSGDVTARPRPPPSPAQSPRRPRRPSLSPRDKPAGDWSSDAARSQPAPWEGRWAGRAGGAQPVTRRRRHSSEQPASGSSSGLGSPRPCQCPCGAAASNAGEVRQAPARPPAPLAPHLRPAARARSPHLHPLRPGRGAPALRPCCDPKRGHCEAPSLPDLPPSPQRTMGEIQGCPPFRCRWRRSLCRDLSCSGRGSPSGGLTRPAGSGYPRLSPAIPLSWRGATCGAAGGAAPRRRGRGGMESGAEDADAAPGRVRGCRASARGESAQGCRARAAARVPGVGEGGSWSLEQNRQAGRGLRRWGLATRVLAPPGCPSPPPTPETPAPFQKDPALGRGCRQALPASQPPAPL